MAAIPLIIPALTTDDGTPVSGALIVFKKKGTATNQVAYLDSALTIPSQNPEPCDAGGRQVAYLNGSLSYDIFVKSADLATTYLSATFTANSDTVSFGDGWADHLSKPLPFFFAADAPYNVVGDATTDNTAGLNAVWAAAVAAGGGVVFLPAGTIKATGALAINGSNVTTRGMGRKATTLYSTYAVGPAITLGDGTTQSVEYAFEDMRFVGVASQTMIQTRWVRGLYIRRCAWFCDRFLWLGLASDTASKPTYIVHLIDCPDAAHLIGQSPTLHHIYCGAFAGQFIMTDTFVEGGYVAGLDGFYATDNACSRIDHFVVSGGYFSRFRDNYSFVDARIVNMLIATNHLSEGALRNAFRFEVTTSTAKSVANVGWEKVFIGGMYSATGGNAIYVRCERTGVGVTSLSFGELVFTSDNVYGPVLIQSDAGEPIEIVSITSITVDMVPINTSQDIVRIVGGSATTTIESFLVGAISGRASTNAFRSALRVEGRIGRISHGLITVENCTTPLDDQTSATPMVLTAATMATGDYVNILDQSTGSTRPATLQNLATYLGGIADVVQRAKTATRQAFRVTVTNTAGTLQGKITGKGDSSGAAHADYIAKITGASTSLQNIPTATDSSTAFVGGMKIASGDPTRLILDATAAQTTNLGLPECQLVVNTSGTDVLLETGYQSANVNGVTQNRPCIYLRRTSDGADFSWSTTNIPSGKTIAFDFDVYAL